MEGAYRNDKGVSITAVTLHLSHHKVFNSTATHEVSFVTTIAVIHLPKRYTFVRFGFACANFASVQ